MKMESFKSERDYLPKKTEESGGDRKEKIEQAQMSIAQMFDKNMEARGVIKRILETSSFGGPEER